MNTLYSLFLWALVLIVSLPATSQSFAAEREDVGISAERLKRVDAFVARLQAEDKLAGAVTVVARRGKLVSLRAHGFADLETKRLVPTVPIPANGGQSCGFRP